MRLPYGYCLRPGAAAVAALTATWHRPRWVWNQCARARNDRLPFTGDKDLTAVRSRIPWLGGGSVVAQQPTMRTFATKGHKKFTSAMRTLASLRGFSICGDGLPVPAGVCIPVVWSGDLHAPPASVRVLRDSIGHAYASFVLQAPEAVASHTRDCFGTDRGVSQIASGDHDGYNVPHVQHGRRRASALTRYQKMMARRKRPRGRDRRGSKG